MAYQSLYRRRRPQKFSEMTGQEHVTRTLSNALSRGRIAHAYLFCGPRGTGKTTAAKIMARAMNCEKFPVAEPCGECTNCKNITAGISIDVIEMDAASNRGIDEIRELRERTRFASGECRYKVYIIDEAHMLTTEASNAFLKTLEEPPPNVVFILATTDPSRLPSTIVSRCQRFDFHLLSVDQITGCLSKILQEEGWQAEEEAIRLIARLADGSLRDALGILEQGSSYGEDIITAEVVRSVTGATRVETIASLAEAALDNDLDSGMKALEEIIYSGRDLQLFMRDLVFVFSRLLQGEGEHDEEGYSLYGFEKLIRGQQGKIEQVRLFDAVELLHEVGSELRHAHFPQYILEVAFIRLLRLLHGRVKEKSLLRSTVESEQQPETMEQPERAEEKAPVQTGSTGSKIEKPAAEEEQTVEPADSSGMDSSMERLAEAWPRLLQEIKKRQRSTAAWLEPAAVGSLKGRLVTLIYPQEYTIHCERIMGESHRRLVEEVLSAFCDDSITIKADLADDEKVNASSGEPAKEKKHPAEKKDQPPAPGAEEAMELFGGKIIDSQ
ncbi:MAG: DNA polymerase III subunit gamma/tau [Bacillota bacterium]|nr:DNA polymerase III subunit gamma/tau [Bacillota bacterium]